MSTLVIVIFFSACQIEVLKFQLETQLCKIITDNNVTEISIWMVCLVLLFSSQDRAVFASHLWHILALAHYMFSIISKWLCIWVCYKHAAYVSNQEEHCLFLYFAISVNQNYVGFWHLLLGWGYFFLHNLSSLNFSQKCSFSWIDMTCKSFSVIHEFRHTDDKPFRLF